MRSKRRDAWADWRTPARCATARQVWTRTAGLAAFMAFLCLWKEAPALLGAGGLYPADRVLPALAGHESGFMGFLLLPSLFWLGNAEWLLGLAAGLGLAAAFCLFLDLRPKLAAAVAWYLLYSFVAALPPPLHLKSDAFLLEALLVAALWTAARPCPAGLSWRPGQWLARWLALRTLLLPALTVLGFGAGDFLKLTALDAQYDGIAFPTALNAWMQLLPHHLQLSLLVLLAVLHLAVPAALLLPWRAVRLAAAGAWIVYQLASFAATNSGVVPLLEAAVVLVLLRERDLEPATRISGRPAGDPAPRWLKRLQWAVMPAIVWSSFFFVIPASLEKSGSHVEFFARQLATRYLLAGLPPSGLIPPPRRAWVELQIRRASGGVPWERIGFRNLLQSADSPGPWLGVYAPRFETAWYAYFSVRSPFFGDPPGIPTFGSVLIERARERSEPVGRLFASMNDQGPFAEVRDVRLASFRVHMRNGGDKPDDPLFYRVLQGYLPPTATNEVGPGGISAVPGER